MKTSTTQCSLSEYKELGSSFRRRPAAASSCFSRLSVVCFLVSFGVAVSICTRMSHVTLVRIYLLVVPRAKNMQGGHLSGGKTRKFRKCELTLPKALLVEGGNEEKEEEEEGRQREKKVLKAVLAAGLVNSTIRCDLAGKV